MKSQLLLFLILMPVPFCAMQPAQWIRNADESIIREETADKLIKTTQEALQTIKKVQSQGATRQLKRLVYNSNAFWNKSPQLKTEIERLLKLGADPNITIEIRVGFEFHYHVETLSLEEIAILNYPEIIDLLLAYGAEPLGLHKAIKIGSESIVRSLIRHGADPNAQSQDLIWLDQSNFVDRVSPLNYAIFLRNIAMFKLLMDLGADPDLKDGTNQSAKEKLAIALSKPIDLDLRAIYQAMLDDAQKLKRKLP